MVRVRAAAEEDGARLRGAMAVKEAAGKVKAAESVRAAARIETTKATPACCESEEPGSRHVTLVEASHTVPLHADPPSRAPTDTSQRANMRPATVVAPTAASARLYAETDDTAGASKERVSDTELTEAESVRSTEWERAVPRAGEHATLVAASHRVCSHADPPARARAVHADPSAAASSTASSAPLGTTFAARGLRPVGAVLSVLERALPLGRARARAVSESQRERLAAADPPSAPAGDAPQAASARPVKTPSQPPPPALVWEARPEQSGAVKERAAVWEEAAPPLVIVTPALPPTLPPAIALTAVSDAQRVDSALLPPLLTRTVTPTSPECAARGARIAGALAAASGRSAAASKDRASDMEHVRALWVRATREEARAVLCALRQRSVVSDRHALASHALDPTRRPTLWSVAPSPDATTEIDDAAGALAGERETAATEWERASVSEATHLPLAVATKLRDRARSGSERQRSAECEVQSEERHALRPTLAAGLCSCSCDSAALALNATTRASVELLSELRVGEKGAEKLSAEQAEPARVPAVRSTARLRPVPAATLQTTADPDTHADASPAVPPTRPLILCPLAGPPLTYRDTDSALLTDPAVWPADTTTLQLPLAPLAGLHRALVSDTHALASHPEPPPLAASDGSSSSAAPRTKSVFAIRAFAAPSCESPTAPNVQAAVTLPARCPAVSSAVREHVGAAPAVHVTAEAETHEEASQA
eukprot:1293847-Rhodomonas_salina.2